MKRVNGLILLALLVLSSLLLATAVYMMLPKDNRLMVNAWMEFMASPIAVPLCYSQVGNELGIESGYVRTYVIESLSFGMTPSEVEMTLSQIAPVDVLETYIVDSTQTTYASIRVHLCNNPFGDVVLDTYYSQDNGLVRVEDVWSD